MKTRIVTAIIFGLIMGLFIIPGFWSVHFTVLLLIIIGIMASFELTHALNKIDIRLNKFNLMLFNLAFVPGLLYLLLTGVEILSSGDVISNAKDLSYKTLFAIDTELLTKLIIIYGIVFLILIFFSLFKPLFKLGYQGLKLGMINIAAGSYISLPLFAGFLLLYIFPVGWYLFVLAIITPWVCDTAALFCGILWGKKKLAATISPNKTMAGFYGGVVSTIILYLLLQVLLVPDLFGISAKTSGVVIIIVIAACIGVLTQLGDLLASAIKRICGLKDFSNLMPGHGGVIDRFDSTFFTFIAILTIALLVNFF